MPKMKKTLNLNILTLKLFKNLIFIGIFNLVSPLVNAETTEITTSIPETSKHLVTYRDQVTEINRFRLFSDTSFSMTRCEGLIDGLKNRLTFESIRDELQMDKCANIFIQYNRCDNDFTLCAAVYCEERNPSQQALAAAAKQCSLQFTPECFQLLPKFDSLQKQNIIQINKNVCDEF